jgi:cytochrome c oxidase assembly protein subunit 11
LLFFLVGYAVYTVDPPDMGLYFNKVQCFCFEEQLLAPGEIIDLPVLFYLDPELAKDKRFSKK